MSSSGRHVYAELYAYNFENRVWVEGGASFFPAKP